MGYRTRDLLGLTRARVVMLVVLTAVPPLLLDTVHLGALRTGLVLLGIALLGAGASALNAWFDRDIDALMERTRDRPLPSGRLAPQAALAFGASVCALALTLLAVAGTAAAALMGVAIVVLYCGVYTAWLKRRSAWNMVIGAFPGAGAPLVADLATDARFDGLGVALFAIVALWQLPHFWSIGLFRAEDYQRAGIPMFPAHVGAPAARWAILATTLALVPVTLVPWGLGFVGLPYAILAAGLGLAAVAAAIGAVRRGTAAADRRVFRFSLLHLGGVCGSLLVAALAALL